MNSEAAKLASTLLFYMVIGLIAALCVIGFFGPGPGAAEGQRTLEIGPIWISRIHEDISGSGSHRWWTEVNWIFLLGVVIAAAAVGLTRTLMDRGSAS